VQIGMIGLGRMGGGLAERLRRGGHEVVGYDRDPSLTDVPTLEALVERLSKPRVAWVMVPAGAPTQQTVDTLATLLEPGDIVVEGGNSFYRDSIRRAEELAARGIRFIDAGVSGGVWGLEEGFCIMVGGEPATVATVEPGFHTLVSEGGYAHVGPIGAGHYTKMVHNGIEYGLLQAYAEGFDLLEHADFDVDMKQIASLWNHGSVVRSWLLELAERAFERDPHLESLTAYVDDSGEGRWTVQEAIERGVPAGVIAQSVFTRFASRDPNAFGLRLIAALRNEFGGHAVRES